MRSDIWLEARFAETRPKALAALTRQFRDVDLAEEAFSLSCLRAIQVWPDKGLPDDPFAWLLVVARNAGLDLLRRRSREQVYVEDAALQPTETVTAEPLDPGELRDDVLRLLFICCHPDLTARDQSALALKVVVGLDVSAIARAFLVNPKAMEQRLTRARRVVGQADVPFESPALAERHARLKTVSLMLYLMFSEGWSASADDVQRVEPLCEESIRLARLLLNFSRRKRANGPSRILSDSALATARPCRHQRRPRITR